MKFKPGDKVYLVSHPKEGTGVVVTKRMGRHKAGHIWVQWEWLSESQHHPDELRHVDIVTRIGDLDA